VVLKWLEKVVVPAAPVSSGVTLAQSARIRPEIFAGDCRFAVCKNATRDGSALRGWSRQAHVCRTSNFVVPAEKSSYLPRRAGLTCFIIFHMKTLIRFLVVASLIVIAGSIYLGQQVSSAKSERYSLRGGDDDDRAEERITERIDNLHLAAKIPSVIYFGAAMVAFFAAARTPGLSNGLRMTLRITSGLCLGMLVWSLALSARVSMDEVTAAWIVAPLLIGGLAFMLMRQGSPSPAAVSAPPA
jgi:hypothetical protein